MEEVVNFSFDSPKGQSSYIKVIGVGGGGGNAVNHMFRQGIKGVDFIICNTDMKALNASPIPAPNKIPLGDLGLGAGNKPERARQAALDKADDIREAIAHNTQMLFITAGMGGGTGTGAAPVIAEIAKSIDLDQADTKKILVVAIVTLPFSTEGRRRREQAEAGIIELSKHVDSILVINNDKLLTFRDFTLSKAFGMANDVLLTAAKGIAEIITVDAYVNIDFQDVNTVMENSGTALMGAGSGKGENRAHDAIEAATTSVLLNDNDIRGAKNILIYYSYSSEHEITMEELGEINEFILDKTDGTADVIWGAGADDSLDDELKVTLIATGFEKNVVIPEPPKVLELPKDEETVVSHQPAAVAVQQPIDEPVIIHREAPAVSGQQAAVSSQQAAVSGQQAAGSGQQAAVSGQQSVVSSQQSAVSGQQVEPEPVAVVPPVFVAPIPAPAPEPVVEVHPISPATKHVIPLDDIPEEPADSHRPSTVSTHDDALVEEIRLVDSLRPSVSEEQAAVSGQQAAVSGQQIARSAFDSLNDQRLTEDRAKRIAYMHDLLRNNPNGADIAQKISAVEYAGSQIFEGRHSSERESSAYSMSPDGLVTKNVYFDDESD